MKHATQATQAQPEDVLIAPEGIETADGFNVQEWAKRVLIAPEGIETKRSTGERLLLKVLIAPEGIESLVSTVKNCKQLIVLIAPDGIKIIVSEFL